MLYFLSQKSKAPPKINPSLVGAEILLLHTLHVLHLLDLHQVHLHNFFQIWLLCFGKREKKRVAKKSKREKKSGKKSREKKKVLCKIQKFQLDRKIFRSLCVVFFNLGAKVQQIHPHIFLGLHQLDFSTSPFLFTPPSSIKNRS